MKSMYDFIIFEHSGLRNHFIDLQVIGKMLVDCGYSVAIANVTLEANECADSGLPVLNVKTHKDAFKNNNQYLKAVFDELSPLTKNFYVGSILSSSDLSWLRYVPTSKKVFLWALRSFFFTSYRRIKLSRHYPILFIRSLRNKRITRSLSNICFFVSEPIIIDELIELGYRRDRMVLRPERLTKSFQPVKDVNTKPLSLLSIGALREEKRIDLCIDALDAMGKDCGIHLTIAGKAYTIHGYDKMLERRSIESACVSRISRRLTDEEYNSLIKQSDYLILCDEKQPGCITNGTMAEALLAGRPIIAPNYNPYKYYVEKYGIGILYELHNRESLIQALDKAKSMSPNAFAEGIRKYQLDFTYERVLSNFSKELSTTLND